MRLANLAASSHPSDEIALIGSRSPERLNDEIFSELADYSLFGDRSHQSFSRSVCFVQKMAVRGVRYAAKDVIERDSNVIFRRRNTSSQSEALPGRIFKIFTATPSASSSPDEVTPFVAIQPYQRLSDEVLPEDQDKREDILDLDRVCRSFTPMCGYLSSTRTESVCVVHATNIICHFAKLLIEEEVMHVLHLDRVSTSCHPPVYTSSDGSC